MPKQTPSQTVGPYYRIGMDRKTQNILVSDETQGERIRIEGRVFDGAGDPVEDAVIEIWQANTHGRYDHPDDDQDKPLDPAFKGWGRAAGDAQGNFWFETIKPGQVPGPGNAMQAPHINVTIFARGMLLHAITRMYFEDEDTNDTDTILNSVEEVRRPTLVAARGDAGGHPVYRFDINLQGHKETVFFDT